MAQTHAVNARSLYFASIAEKVLGFLDLFECVNDALVCVTCFAAF